MPFRLLHKTSQPHNIIARDQQAKGSSNSNICVPPSSNDSSNTSYDPSSDDIPKNILAFRSITMLLDYVRERRYNALEDEHQLSHDERRELRICTAFSTIAVINHEVVAVVASRHHGKLEVMVCANISDDQNQQLIQPQAPGKLQSLLQYLFTQNYRLSGSKTRKEEGTTVRIDKPSIPPGIGAGAGGLKKYVEECW